MSRKNPLSDDLNKNIKIPQAKTGLAQYPEGGKVRTDWKPIRWTRKKILFTSFALGLPYLIAVIATLASGIYLITFILVGLGVMVALLSKVANWLNKKNHL